MSNFTGQEQETYWRDDHDNIRFALDPHAELELYSASSLKHQSAGKHVTPLRANQFLFLLLSARLEPRIYHTRGKHANHHTTDAVSNEHEVSSQHKWWPAPIALMNVNQNGALGILWNNKVHELIKTQTEYNLVLR
jgi:hypothetical protein